MRVITMGDTEVWEKVNGAPLNMVLKKIKAPLAITFVALPDEYTPAGIQIDPDYTYLTIRLPYEQIKNCPGSALDLMKFLLLSQIRHLKHLDWYGLYYEVKQALSVD